MTAPNIVDPAGLLGEALAEASPDLMRTLLQTLINAHCFPPIPTQSSAPNGDSAHRSAPPGVTATGTATSIPASAPSTSRSRGCARAPTFLQWLLERRKRAESALITVVADCYLAGVSTRQMDKLVKTLDIDSWGPSLHAVLVLNSSKTVDKTSA